MATIEQIFQRNGWRYTLSDDYMVTGFDGIQVSLRVDEGREILLVRVPVVPGRGMAGYRPAHRDSERDVAVFLSAINYRLALGAFTRDHRDGEIVYEMSVPVSGGILNDEQVKQVLLATVAAVSRRGPQIIALQFGRITLDQALADLDSGQSPPASMIV